MDVSDSALILKERRRLALFLEPIPLKRGIWQQADTPYWRALQNEFATLQQRLASYLDFFGKPAGYTPMLSLTVGSTMACALAAGRAMLSTCPAWRWCG